MANITVQETDVNNWAATTDAPILRAYYSKSFTAADGTIVEWGNKDGMGVAYKSVTTTLDGTTVTIPSFTIISTRDGIDYRLSRVSFYWFTSSGTYLKPFGEYINLAVDENDTSVSFADLKIFNAGSPALPSDSYYTKSETLRLLASVEGAAADAKYIVQVADADLDNAQALGALATGLLKNTTTTGVLSIAVAGTDYLAPDGSGASLTALNASALSSGTVPAARFPAFTGDVTTSAGAVATTIANNAVTFAKMQNVTTNRLLGRGTASSGNVEEMTLTTGTTGSDFNLAYSAGSLIFHLPDASATARGAITTGAQVIGGAKTLNAKLTTLTTGKSIEALENALSSAMLSTSNENDYGGIGFQRGAAGIAAATGTPFLNIQIHQQPNASVGQTVLNYAFFSSRHGSGATATANGGAEAIYNLAGIIESDATVTSLNSMHDIVGIVGLAIGRSASSARSYGAHFDARLETTSGAAIGAESVVRNSAGTAPTIQSGTEAGRTIGFNIVGRTSGAGSKNTVGLLFQTGNGATSAFKTGIYFEADTVDSSGYAMDFLPLGIIPAMRFANAQPIVGRNAAGNGDVVLFSINSSDQLSFASTGNTSVFGGPITVATSLVINGGTALTTTNQTGTGSLVLATSPTLITPTLGVASATSLTAPNLYGGSGGTATLTIAASSNPTTNSAHIVMNPIAAGASPGAVLIGAPASAYAGGGDLLHLQGPDGVIGLVFFDSYGTSVTSGIAFRTARNTAASPSASQANDTMASFGGRQYGDNAFAASNRAAIQFKCAENATNSAQGTYITLETTPIGSTTRAERVRVTDVGNVKIGGTANRGTTEGTNQLALFDGTAPAGTLTNGISFYSASGEARVMDSAGNSTLLSPHDKADNAWIYHSVDTRTGKVLKIDVEKMFRFLNSHFGTDFVHDSMQAA